MSLVRIESLGPSLARVTLSRPEKRNAINAELAADFEAAVDSMIAGGQRVAVLEADGPVFCAGADLSQLATAAGAVESVLGVLLDRPVHWTAVVKAPVLGAGLLLLAACPRVLVTEAATFALPEVRRGFFPGGVVGRLAASMDARAAFELAFSGEQLDAASAQQLGLVTSVFDGREMDERAYAGARAVADLSATSLAEGIDAWQDDVRRRWAKQR